MTVQMGYSAKTFRKEASEKTPLKSRGRNDTWVERQSKQSTKMKKGGTAMFEDYYMTADDVAKALKISKSFAYKVIRKMNAELQEQGFFTMAGKSESVQSAKK